MLFTGQDPKLVLKNTSKLTCFHTAKTHLKMTISSNSMLKFNEFQQNTDTPQIVTKNHLVFMSKITHFWPQLVKLKIHPPKPPQESALKTSYTAKNHETAKYPQNPVYTKITKNHLKLIQNPYAVSGRVNFSKYAANCGENTKITPKRRSKSVWITVFYKTQNRF